MEDELGQVMKLGAREKNWSYRQVVAEKANGSSRLLGKLDTENSGSLERRGG